MNLRTHIVSGIAIASMMVGVAVASTQGATTTGPTTGAVLAQSYYLEPPTPGPRKLLSTTPTANPTPNAS